MLALDQCQLPIGPLCFICSSLPLAGNGCLEFIRACFTLQVLDTQSHTVPAFLACFGDPFGAAVVLEVRIPKASESFPRLLCGNKAFGLSGGSRLSLQPCVSTGILIIL